MLLKAIAKELGEKVGKLKWKLTKDEEAEPFTKEQAIINREGTYYPPVATVTLAYPKFTLKDMELSKDFGNLQHLPGFGLLNSLSEGIRILGTMWSFGLFPEQCSENYNIQSNYIGGSCNPVVAIECPIAQGVEIKGLAQYHSAV